MKKAMVLAIILLGSFSLNAQRSIQGSWNTGKENTIVEIKEANNTIEGKIVSSANTNVPIGKLIIKDIYYSDGKYKGKLYSIKKEKWFDASFIPNGGQLSVKISAGWKNKTVEWKKTNQYEY